MAEFTLVTGTGQFVVTQEGARVAGLHPRVGLPNLLWRGDTMPFSGGDRLWIAPETELFYRGDPADRSNWFCPPELDPGSWEVQRDERSVTLHQTALGTTMRREITPLFETQVVMDLPWAGYRVTDEVASDRRWSAWHIVMVPAPAQVFVHQAHDPVVMVEPAPPIVDGWVEVTGQAPAWKLGFPPPSDGNVLLAAVGVEDPGPLVVVRARAEPAGIYVDVPPAGGPATAMQIWNAGGEGFCELEHHAPLGQSLLDAVVLGVWGERAARLRLVEHVLENLAA